MQRPLSLVTGAAGFIGSHLTDRLLTAGHKVIGVDNFLLGRKSNLLTAFRHPNFRLIEADLNDYDTCLKEVSALAKGAPLKTVWHNAANSDIRAGTTDPEVDLRHTFLTTFNVLKLMRALSCRQIVFASSSAIYGPKDAALTEDAGPLLPISNYGAMKLASEAVISAGLENALERAWVLRFPNVVGSRATHGVIFDFLEKLKGNPAELEVLGDGTQAKPYLHVSELVDAMLFVQRNATERWNCFNVGTDGTVTTVRHIAELVVGRVAPQAVIKYTGGTKGWPGDVPRFHYSIEKLRALGWVPKLTSDQAVSRAVEELIAEQGP